MAIQDLTVSLDLKQNLNIYATCKQFDDLILELNIYDNSLQADLSNYDVRLKALKSDKVSLIQQHIGITINSNIVNIEADEQLTTTSGKTIVELQFINKTTGKKKATFNLVLIVVPSVLDVNTTISKSTYTLLEELENKLDQASDFFENIDGAITANNELKETITDSETAKNNLDGSISTADTSKIALDTSNTNATNTKNALDALKTSADNTKNALNTANQTGQTLLDSLETFEEQHADVIDISNKLANINADLSENMQQINDLNTNKADKSALDIINNNVANNTSSIAIKADKSYVDTKLGNMGNTKTFKGSTTFANLPTSGNANDDYYYVTDKTSNYCWNDSAWIDIGNNVNIGDNTVTSAKRTVLGTKVIGFANNIDYSTTAKTLTYSNLWINYNNKSVHVADGALDLSISTTNSVIVFDSLSGTLKNLGDSTTGITEDQILLGVISLSIPYNSIMYTNVFSINGNGNIDSTKLANGAVKFIKRTPIGSVAFAYGTYTWDTDNKTFTCASDAWINYGAGVGITLASVSLNITSNSFIVFDISTNSIKVVGNYSSISDNQILLCFLNPAHWDKSFNVCIGRILVKQGMVTQSLEDAKHWDTQIPEIRLSTITNKVKGKNYACLGDSITSNQVSGLGTTISNILGCTLVGNFATGWSTCSDWHSGDSNITTITLTTPQNTDTNDNVLSNQVRRLLQYTTASGAQITWTHPINGTFSLDTSVGTGLGNTANIPDIIYIAIGTNDGKNSNVPINDDTDTVFGQTYSQLTRNSIASALRWAIETLQSAYPNANIFVASPLQTNCSNNWMSFANGLLKRNIIQKVCQFCSVHFVDSFNESGYSTLKAKSGLLSVDGIHPNSEGAKYVYNFVSGEIKNRFILR